MTAPPQTQSPAGAAAAFYGWTVTSLALIALAAIVVIAGVIYGMHLARQRHRSADAAEERAADTGLELPETPMPPPAADGGGLPGPAPAPKPDPQSVPTPPAPAPEPLPERDAPAPAQLLEPETARVAPEQTPEPATTATSGPAATIVEPAIASALSLTTIKGLGPKVAAMLADRGITRVDQIAALTPDAATALDAELGSFTGRMGRDRWIEQAILLSSGDTAAYEAEFGKLG